jgi:hypothetical protein
LREVVPKLRLLATIVNVGAPGAILETREVQATAPTLGLEVVPLELRLPEDIAPAFEGLNDRADEVTE